MTISSVSLYDFCNKKAQSLSNRVNEILHQKNLSERQIENVRVLMQDACYYNDIADEIKSGVRDDKAYLPPISFKNGFIQIGNFKQRTEWLKNFIDLSFCDLRYKNHKLEAIKEVAAKLNEDRFYAVQGGATQEDMDLIFNLSCKGSDDLKMFIN